MTTIPEELRKIPPQQIEAEQSLLGGIMLENVGLPAALETLKGDEFYRESHRIIFKVIQQLFERNEPIDLVTVADALAREDKLESVGGASYLASLVEAAPSATNVPAYAKIVNEKALLRQLLQTADQIASWCYDGKKVVEEVLDHAEAAVFSLSSKRFRSAYFPVYDIVKKNIEVIESFQETRSILTGVPSHYEDLDALTAGFQRADLIIVAGRPSMGKTAFALNLAKNAAFRSGIPVGFFSLEMSKEQLAMRLLCLEARVDSHKIRTGFLGQQDCAKMLTAAGRFINAPIFIDDTPALTTLELRAKSRRMMAEHELGMIIVDYLQLLRSRQRIDSREQEISDISRSLKALAKELDVPVVALSQLNRKVEERHDKRPQLSDLRESGAIEQDADVVAFIYRDEVYNPDTTEKRVAEILVRKQRNGPTGNIKLFFNELYTGFESYAKEAM